MLFCIGLYCIVRIVLFYNELYCTILCYTVLYCNGARKTEMRAVDETELVLIVHNFLSFLALFYLLVLLEQINISKNSSNSSKYAFHDSVLLLPFHIENSSRK